MVEIDRYWFGIVKKKGFVGKQKNGGWDDDGVDQIDVVNWVQVDLFLLLGGWVVKIMGGIVVCCFVQCNCKNNW